MASIAEQLEACKRKLEGHDNWDEKNNSFKKTNSNPERRERLLFRMAKLHNQMLLEFLKHRAASGRPIPEEENENIEKVKSEQKSTGKTLLKMKKLTDGE